MIHPITYSYVPRFCILEAFGSLRLTHTCCLTLLFARISKIVSVSVVVEIGGVFATEVGLTCQAERLIGVSAMPNTGDRVAYAY